MKKEKLDKSGKFLLSVNFELNNNERIQDIKIYKGDMVLFHKNIVGDIIKEISGKIPKEALEIFDFYAMCLPKDFINKL